MEPFEAMGIFWEPDSPSRTHQGILTLDDGQNMNLKLAGFGSATIQNVGPEPRKIMLTDTGEVIHGSTTAGLVSLLGWYKTDSSSGSDLSESWAMETVEAVELVVGAHFDLSIPILSWTVKLEAVKEWVHLGLRRLNKTFDHGETGVGTLHIGAAQNRRMDATGEHVTDITMATMVYNVPQDIDQARRDMVALDQILTLSTGVQPPLQDVTMGSDGLQSPFEFHSKALQGPRSTYEPSAFHAPLAYEAIAGSAGIAKWIQRHENFALPLHAMLNMQRHHAPDTVSELDFLSAWLAVEFYLGQKSKNHENLEEFAEQFFTKEEKQIIDLKKWAKVAAKARNDIVHMNEPQPEPTLWLNSIDVLKMLVVRKMLALCGLDWKGCTMGYGHNQTLYRLSHAVKQEGGA
ncbi:MAG: hypothetical protein OXE17_16255 [Chloroflexi bacterium]|nr:hypothetical protein [Chloroflexota bacterium]